MQAILQTDFSGIDGLKLVEVPIPTVPADGILIKTTMLPVVPSDWKRELNPQATAEAAAKLPRTIGIGGVGRVVEVGTKQDVTLLDQRVLTMNLAGSYSEYSLITQRNFVFPLPDTVSDAQAAALTAGPGTALTLLKEIKKRSVDNVIITGANSVIGLILLQQLATLPVQVWPLVTQASQAYFNEQRPGQPSYQIETLPTLGSTLIVDIAGSDAVLQHLLEHVPDTPIVSIAITASDSIPNLTFVHEEFDAANYKLFIQQVADGTLSIPLDRSFTFAHTKAAQRYAKAAHSRGRVLVTLDEKEIIYD